MRFFHFLALIQAPFRLFAGTVDAKDVSNYIDPPQRFPWDGAGFPWLWCVAVVLALALPFLAYRAMQVWDRRRAQGPAKEKPRPAPVPPKAPAPASAKPTAKPKTPAAPGSTMQAANEVTLVGGKYLLLQELGRGGMGVVYEAENTLLGKHVALKIMREELRFNPRDRRKFLEEARNLAKLEHANVVGILDVLEEPNQDTWLVMELVRGRSLKDRLDVEERLGFDEARRIMADVLKALDYVHRKKVVHRDLKPGNVMLGEEGQVKVMDFGIARQVKDLVTRTTGADSSGTMAYMGPEQHLGRFDARTDLFAFGVLFYETLCGELPFQAGDLLLAKKMKSYRPLAELGVSLPPEAWALIQDCLEPEPDQRPTDAAEALKRLARI